MKKILLIIILTLIFGNTNAQVTTAMIDWDRFLSQHDMTWDSIPANYYAGAIMGNGLLGTNIYASGQGGYRWDIGRSDVTERRNGSNNLYHKARLEIGHFELQPVDQVISEEMRLSLYNATTTGKITTPKGSIKFKTYVDANNDMIVIDTQASGAEVNFGWSWHAGHAISPRTTFKHTHGQAPEDYLANPNPEPYYQEQDGINLCIQELYSGYTYVTASKVIQNMNNRKIYITVSFENSTQEAIDAATQNINSYLSYGAEKAAKEHREWWHAYYPASFMYIPDARMESFYWIQQYKLACLTRADKGIIDLMGPWTYRTPWPAIWWNLNIQLTYSPLFVANRPELSEPLWKSLNDNLQTLINNVPVPEWRNDAAVIGRASSYDLSSRLNREEAERNQHEVGNLTWTLYYYWEYCTHKHDTQELVKRFYPLLKRAIAYYSHILYKGNDGKYHLPLTASPEYKPAEDCNYDLAILRWGLNTLLDINDHYNLNDPLNTHWRDVALNLTEYPIDENQGFMIGKDVKLESSHRHYSHLLMIYPFRLVTPDKPENRELILRSLEHWIGLKGALQGYTFTGASSIYSLLGDGNNAMKCIDQLLDKYIQPNTLYKETGPVIETPLSAVTSLQDMYLQNWNEVIRIFPAVPDQWKNTSFINFLTKQGLLVSAKREDGKTSFIQIESPKVNTTCTIKTDMDVNELTINTIGKKSKARFQIVDKQQGIIQVDLHKGDILQIKSPSYHGEPFFIQNQPKTEQSYYGVIK